MVNLTALAPGAPFYAVAADAGRELIATVFVVIVGATITGVPLLLQPHQLCHSVSRKVLLLPF